MAEGKLSLRMSREESIRSVYVPAFPTRPKENRQAKCVVTANSMETKSYDWDSTIPWLNNHRNALLSFLESQGWIGEWVFQECSDGCVAIRSLDKGDIL